MARKRVVVLYGGRADEHSISCVSAAGVLNAIDTDRYEPIPVGITKDGRWIVGGEDPRRWSLNDTQLPTVQVTEGSRPVILDMARGGDGFMVGDHDDLVSGTDRLKADSSQSSGSLEPLGHVDAVFPVLHGPYGEDGTVQGLLEMMGVPYVGCGVFASAACMDKHYTKILLSQAGIPVAPGITIDARDHLSGVDLKAAVEEAGLHYPLFVKPSRAGSSFGVVKVEETGADALAAAVDEASGHDWRILIEEGVEGREIECAVLAPHREGEPRTAWPGEVVLDRTDQDEAFYDFDSKYVDSSASHVEVPTDLPDETLSRIRALASRAFKAVDATGLSRVDCFVTAEGGIIVNEINTLPGFTPISMYAKAWEASGVTYTDLITELIEGVSA
nr:D-alanine--D-alanine ligase family protein [Bifidobacterium indicum]